MYDFLHFSYGLQPGIVRLIMVVQVILFITSVGRLIRSGGALYRGSDKQLVLDDLLQGPSRSVTELALNGRVRYLIRDIQSADKTALFSPPAKDIRPLINEVNNEFASGIQELQDSVASARRMGSITSRLSLIMALWGLVPEYLRLFENNNRTGLDALILAVFQLSLLVPVGYTFGVVLEFVADVLARTVTKRQRDWKSFCRVVISA